MGKSAWSVAVLAFGASVSGSYAIGAHQGRKAGRAEVATSAMAAGVGGPSARTADASKSASTAATANATSPSGAESGLAARPSARREQPSSEQPSRNQAQPDSANSNSAGDRRETQKPTTDSASTAAQSSGKGNAKGSGEAAASKQGTQSTQDAQRSAVARRVAIEEYFAELHRLQTGIAGQEPEAFALVIMHAVTQGDRSQLRRLDREGEAAKARLKALQPPDEARSYHASLRQLVERSHAMLGRLIPAVDDKDMLAIASLSAEAQKLRAQADALQDQEIELRTRYR